MKNTLKNMIDFETLTKVRNSVNSEIFLPEKDNLVSIVALEYFGNSVKVLIDGKIFVAEIDEKIPLKDELIALVVEKNPITLSLNLRQILSKNKSTLYEQIFEKFKISVSQKRRENLTKIIMEEKPLLKSKFLTLDNVTEKIKAKELELSLLINLIWKFSEKDVSMILDLYENLFAVSFSTTCKYLFNSIKDLLLSEENVYLLNEINTKLIYDQHRENVIPLLNKSESLLNLIKYLNESNLNSAPADEFIKFSSIYIMQKSVFKSYDYFPDFVIIKKSSGFALIKYNIKKLYLSNGQPSYKLTFDDDEIPVKVNGYLRNNFLFGSIDAENYENDILIKEIDHLKSELKEKWEINSDFNLSEEHILWAERKYKKNGLNKLVS